MSDIIGRGVIEVSADASKLRAGISDAKSSLNSLRDAAKNAGETLNKESIKYLQSLERQDAKLKGQAATFGKSKSEIAAYNAELLKVGKTADGVVKSIEASERSIKSQAEAAALAAKQNKFLEGLGSIPLTARNTPQSLTAQGQALGIAPDRLDPLIAKWHQVELAAKKAADEERRAVSNADFVNSAFRKADVLTGKPQSEIFAADAARRGIDPKQTAAAVEALRRAEQGLDKMGDNARLARFKMQQLGFQLQDFFVQVQAGQNPLTAFIQQGSQLSGTFGGAGNAFRAVIGLLTPLRVGLIGAGAALTGVGLAAAHVEGLNRTLSDLQSQLSATGRAGSISDTQLRGLIDSLARAPGVTRDAATSIVGELTKANEIGVNLFDGIGRAAIDFAKATGTDVPNAAKVLAKAFAEPEAGAKTLEGSLGTLRSGYLLTIEKLVRANDIVGAQRVLLAALEEQIKGLGTRGVTPLQTATNDLGNAWNDVMRSFEKSDGLTRLITLTASAVTSIAGLITKMREADKEWREAFSGGLNGVVARAIGLTPPTPNEPNPRKRSGVVTIDGAPPQSVPTLGQPAAANGSQAADQTIKKALELGKAYEGVSGEIARLTGLQKTLRSALDVAGKEYGKQSDQYKKLAVQIAGVGEAIERAKKKGVGKIDREPEQVRKALLDADLKFLQEKLSAERDTIAFHNQQAAALLQAGNISLKQFYDQKNKDLADSIQLEKNLLTDQQARLEVELEVVKDPSDSIRLNTELQESLARSAKLAVSGDRAIILANLEAEASFKQLGDQVRSFKAELLGLQGNDSGAARARAEEQVRQARDLAKRSQGAPNPADRINDAELNQTERAIEQRLELQRITEKTSQITQRLQIEEERIALKTQTGVLSENGALIAQGEARRKVIALLESELAAKEKILALRPNDENLALDVERTRLELEKLGAVLDPLKDKFDNLFKSASAGAIEGLLNGDFSKVNADKREKALQDVEKRFDRKGRLINEDSTLTSEQKLVARSKLEKERSAAEDKARKENGSGLFQQAKAAGTVFAQQISQALNKDAAKAFSDALFSKDGAFGKLGGIVAEAFGSGEKGGGFLDKLGGIFGGKTDIGDFITGTTGGTLNDILKKDKPSAERQSILELFKPKTDTSSVTASFVSLQNNGIEPTTLALNSFKQALDAATGAARNGVSSPAQVPSGEQTIADLFKFGGTSNDPTAANSENEFDKQSTAAERVTDSNKQLSRTNERAAASVIDLATSASRGSSALGLLPSIINLISTSSAAQGAAKGIGNFISGLFSSSSSGSSGFGTGSDFGNQDYGSFFHSGGVVGQTHDIRPVPTGIFSGAAKYHDGGIVGGAPAAPAPIAALAANEVPAILMGGPKGTREEVLTASDPRHSDNLTPSLLRVIEGAAGGSGGPGGKAEVHQVAALLKPQVSQPAISLSAAGGRAVGGNAVGGNGGDAFGGRGGDAVGGKGGAGGKGGDALTRFLIGPTATSLISDISKQTERISQSLVVPEVNLPKVETKQIAALFKPQVNVERDKADKTINSLKTSVFNSVQRYHTGGIVKTDPTPGLSVNEVPAVLLGGPKGVREEVLHASDPRHSDNLTPSILKLIAEGGMGGKGGDGGNALATARNTISPIVQALTSKSVFTESEVSSETTDILREIKATGARALGGPVSANNWYRINENGPEILNMGGHQYMMPMQDGSVSNDNSSNDRIVNVRINQTFAPGTTKETIGQGGVKAGRAVQRELSRGTA